MKRPGLEAKSAYSRSRIRAWKTPTACLVLAGEIAEDLQAAMELFAGIAGERREK